MKKLLLLVIVVLFSLTACQKDWDQIVEDNQVNEEVTSMSEMVVSSEFDWKTTKDVDINFSGIDKNDVIYIKSIDGDVYLKEIVKSGVNYSTKITVPTYTSEVNVIYKGSLTNIPISDNVIAYKFI